jgi:hypothetical protein
MPMPNVFAIKQSCGGNEDLSMWKDSKGLSDIFETDIFLETNSLIISMVCISGVEIDNN